MLKIAKKVAGLSVIGALVLGVSSSVIADPKRTVSADFKVIGKFAPPICKITAPQGDTYNFGILPLPYHDTKEISKRVRVTCTEPVLGNFKLTDNRTDTLPASMSGEDSAFGLGKTKATTAIGSYAIVLKDIRIDDKAYSDLNGKGLLKNHQYAYDPVTPGKRFDTELAVSLNINNAELVNEDLADVRLNGNFTYSFIIGI